MSSENELSYSEALKVITNQFNFIEMILERIELAYGAETIETKNEILENIIDTIDNYNETDCLKVKT